MVKDQLAKTVAEKGGYWDQYLKQVELAYNTAQHSSTGYTPFFLLHGREARLPYSLHNPATSQNDTPLQYVLDLRSRLRHAFQYAQSTNDLARTRQKETYDKKARDNEYQAGDLVWLDNPAMSRKKLEANWRGPYRILTSYSPEPLVRISNLADGKRSVVHKNRIKPYRSEVHQQQPHLPVFRGHDHPHFTALSGSLPPARGRPFIRRPGGSLPPSGGGVHGNRPSTTGGSTLPPRGGPPSRGDGNQPSGSRDLSLPPGGRPPSNHQRSASGGAFLPTGDVPSSCTLESTLAVNNQSGNQLPRGSTDLLPPSGGESSSGQRRSDTTDGPAYGAMDDVVQTAGMTDVTTTHSAASNQGRPRQPDDQPQGRLVGQPPTQTRLGRVIKRPVRYQSD